MPLWLLGLLDTLAGSFLLYVLALPARLAWALLPPARQARPRFVFLKLKGGGSLIIAMPSVLGLRQKNPQAEFVLVCTASSESYAALTGLFDRRILIDDHSLLSLLVSGWHSLRCCFGSALCVDLEPNSLLAAVFAMLTCARRRIGLVKQEKPSRRLAYTQWVAYNPRAPIYIYYDQLMERLGATPAPLPDCRAIVNASLPVSPMSESAQRTIGMAAFTSDFAKERMMPPAVWGELLQREYGSKSVRLLIFGTLKNQPAAQEMAAVVKIFLPEAEILNLCGKYSLAETSSLFGLCSEVWAVDTGLLHLVRLLGIPSRSFWGPTMPSQRLRPIAGLQEQVFYRPFICSPCVQVGVMPPCQGRNLCMITMKEENPDLNPSWVQS